MSQASFLGHMQTVLVGEVVCLTKYEIDQNTKGGALWVRTSNSGMRDDILGDELIKVKMPHSMFEQQKDKAEKGEVVFPGVYEILAQVSVGSGNKAALSAVSILPFIPDARGCKNFCVNGH